MAELLFEIGLEEIPARMIKSAEQELAERLKSLLVSEKLLPADAIVRSYATPRRLAVTVSDVLERQQDVTEQLTGPAWKVAFKDDQPTPAAQAFAKKAGVPIERLVKQTTPKGEYVSATVTKAGRSAAEILAEKVPAELGKIYWAKSMYWRPGKPERFVRPVRWMVALLDATVVPVEFGGKAADSVTYGHRVLHGEAPVTIAAPAEYAAKLEAAFVVADVGTRRERIRKALDRVTRTVEGARWREDEPLVETVTQLTEWPSVVLGTFEREYLELPDEVLVTVMRDHQKYFAVDDASGRLAPHFLTVLNTQVDAAGEAVIRHGNERVLRARFNDARFFWTFDQKTPLVERVELLKAVTFQKDLGSYASKTETNLRLAGALATMVMARGVAVDEPALLTATRLAKADLTAELVKEFTELQGVIGGLYARAEGLGEKVAQAIYWQYRPAAADDAIPPTVEGQLLGLADRMATIVDMFALGLEPTGSKDPFALRRAANGVIRILAESGLPLKLSELERLATSPQQNALAETATSAVAGFFGERLDFYLREVMGYSYDVAKAVLAAGADDVGDAIARAQALTAVRASDAEGHLAAISAAFKRIQNILRQAREKGESYDTAPVANALVEPEELALYAQFSSIAPEVESLRAAHRYAEAFGRIATLRPAVDLFFDKVMVMAPDAAIRRNRLSLIAEVAQRFSNIADFSEIVSS
ncbi:MAG TPA: glycine--tRNA ligase subunit beta [Acidobacteriaceae bacterium]|jgi:glycyl-tRNA synthetase beta chain|nr:glycine--tRNA ligase subunit beta [Acidobacteriaceae bacterium]